MRMGNVGVECVDEVGDRVGVVGDVGRDLREERKEVWEKVVRVEEELFV